jgi:hypothetical protein
VVRYTKSQLGVCASASACSRSKALLVSHTSESVITGDIAPTELPAMNEQLRSLESETKVHGCP